MHIRKLASVLCKKRGIHPFFYFCYTSLVYLTHTLPRNFDFVFYHVELEYRLPWG